MSDEKLNLENLSLKQSLNLLEEKEKQFENYLILVEKILVLRKEISQPQYPTLLKKNKKILGKYITKASKISH